MGKEINHTSVSAHIAERMTAEFQFACYSDGSELAARVESEIELMLLLTFVIVGRLSGMRVEIGDDPTAALQPHVLITPQFQWENYRIDFRVMIPRSGNFVFVECDGHDFHERTKEQAERDRSRDRAIQAAGISVLRFTGREIWRDPERCMSEVLDFLGGLLGESKK